MGGRHGGMRRARTPKRVPLLALLVGAGVWLGLVGTAGAGRGEYFPKVCVKVTYHSAPDLDPQAVCMGEGVSTHNTQPGTYLVLTPGGAGEGIYTDRGTLVWWKAHASEESLDASVVHLWGHPYLAVWSGKQHFIKSSNGYYTDDGRVLLYNEHYQQVGSITAARPFAPDQIDLHEFQLTPQGDALLGISRVVPAKVKGHQGRVVSYVVQKVSVVWDAKHGIHTGRKLFQWSSLSHVPVKDSFWPYVGPSSVYDYFHGNAIAQDSDGNLVISARNTWAIYKVNVKTGRIMWQVGGKGDHKLPGEPWCYQHDVATLGNNEYTVFDNGGVGPKCMTNTTAHPSRGLIFRVNPAKHPAGISLVHAYIHKPAIYVSATGSVQRLSHDDVLVDYGGVPEVTQFSASGHVQMDLSLSGYSYRAYRSPWDGQPLTRPAVAASPSGSGTDVWASWNGSTEVRAWRVLVGMTKGQLLPVGATAPSTGFETSISLGASYPYVAVEALGSKGQVLATSKTISPT